LPIHAVKDEKPYLTDHSISCLDRRTVWVDHGMNREVVGDEVRGASDVVGQLNFDGTPLSNINKGRRVETYQVVRRAGISHIRNIDLENIVVATAAGPGSHVLELEEGPIADKSGDHACEDVISLELGAIPSLYRGWIEGPHDYTACTSIGMGYEDP
jgi:hypothetical protein